MTLEEAKTKRLDVFFFNHTIIRTEAAVRFRNQGRTVTPFQESVHGFTLICLAVSPRPSSGTAAAVKAQRGC
jgi:hypothetical protein